METESARSDPSPVTVTLDTVRATIPPPTYRNTSSGVHSTTRPALRSRRTAAFCSSALKMALAKGSTDVLTRVTTPPTASSWVRSRPNWCVAHTSPATMKASNAAAFTSVTRTSPGAVPWDAIAPRRRSIVRAILRRRGAILRQTAKTPSLQLPNGLRKAGWGPTPHLVNPQTERRPLVHHAPRTRREKSRAPPSPARRRSSSNALKRDTAPASSPPPPTPPAPPPAPSNGPSLWRGPSLLPRTSLRESVDRHPSPHRPSTHSAACHR